MCAELLWKLCFNFHECVAHLQLFDLVIVVLVLFHQLVYVGILLLQFRFVILKRLPQLWTCRGYLPFILFVVLAEVHVLFLELFYAVLQQLRVVLWIFGNCFQVVNWIDFESVVILQMGRNQFVLSMKLSGFLLLALLQRLCVFG